MKNDLYTSYYPSPIGLMKIYFTANNLRKIIFVNSGDINKNPNGTCFDDTQVRKTYNLIYDQLNEYFTGKRKKFELPIDLKGTDFQINVWQNLIKIPYGEIRTYSQIASALGKRNAARAVGNANSKNPLAIIVPCHRVIRADGELSGYNGRIWRKRWLLKHETKYINTNRKDESTCLKNYRKEQKLKININGI